MDRVIIGSCFSISNQGQIILKLVSHSCFLGRYVGPDRQAVSQEEALPEQSPAETLAQQADQNQPKPRRRAAGQLLSAKPRLGRRSWPSPARLGHWDCWLPVRTNIRSPGLSDGRPSVQLSSCGMFWTREAKHHSFQDLEDLLLTGRSQNPQQNFRSPGRVGSSRGLIVNLKKEELKCAESFLN